MYRRPGPGHQSQPALHLGRVQVRVIRDVRVDQPDRTPLSRICSASASTRSAAAGSGRGRRLGQEPRSVSREALRLDLANAPGSGQRRNEMVEQPSRESMVIVMSCGWRFVIGGPRPVAVGTPARSLSGDDLVGRQSVGRAVGRAPAREHHLAPMGAMPALSSEGQRGGHRFGETAHDGVVFQRDDEPVGVGGAQDACRGL